MTFAIGIFSTRISPAFEASGRSCCDWHINARAMKSSKALHWMLESAAIDKIRFIEPEELSDSLNSSLISALTTVKHKGL